MPQRDPYDILGVSRNADADEVKRAYRRLAKRYHPDRNPGDKQAAERFKEVQAAYEVLGDPKRRAEYDRFGAGGPRPDFEQWRREGVHSAPGVHFDFGDLGDLSSIFEQFFSRAGAAGVGAAGGRVRAQPRPARRGANIEHAVEISLEEAARGARRQIVLQNETGESERIEFRIPAGVRDGQKIRIAQKGQHGPAGRGDLFITARIRPHPRFRREGLDLYVDVQVPFYEAALGGRVEVPTLSGASVVTVPAGTSGGAKLRLREQGLRDERQKRTGDLYAVVRLSVPRQLSPRARELMQELAAELGSRRDRPVGANQTA